MPVVFLFLLTVQQDAIILSLSSTFSFPLWSVVSDFLFNCFLSIVSSVIFVSFLGHVTLPSVFAELCSDSTLSCVHETKY